MIDIILFIGFVYAVMVALFSAFMAASIAFSRGRSDVAWFIAGLLLGPLALAVYLLPEKASPATKTARAPSPEPVSHDFTPPPAHDPSAPWAKYR